MDAVEVSVMPVLLGAGTKLLPMGGVAKLRLEKHKIYLSGIVSLKYCVLRRA